MLKVLIKSRFQSLFYSMFKARRSKKNGNKAATGRSVIKCIGIGILVVYIVGCIFLAFGSIFYELCKPIVKIGYDWLYFAMVGIAALAMGFIGSVFTTQAQLYEAKDSELLLSMPIPPRYILASRFIMLLGLTLMYEGMVVLPAGVVYCFVGEVTVLSVVLFIVGYILLAFLIVSLSAVIGWLVNLVTSRMKNKTIVTMVLSLGFMAAYFFLYYKMTEYMQSIIIYLYDIAEAMKKVFYPIYQLGVAIAEHNFLSLLIFALCALVPFTLVYVIISKSFIRMVTRKRGAAKVVYKEKQLKVRSPKGALIRKELNRFTSSAMYMMNAGLGVVFIVVAAVALLIQQNNILSAVSEVKDMDKILVPLLAIVISGLATMNFISAPSISLEGKNLWIPQSIPVDPFDILMAKVDMHLLIVIPPVLLASGVCVFVVKADLLQTILLFLVPIIFTLFSALGGVVMNLLFPKFNWVNEMVAVKQSLSGILTMLGSMAMVILPVVLYVVILNDLLAPEMFMWIVCVVMALICLGLYLFIKKKGTKIFTRLSN